MLVNVFPINNNTWTEIKIAAGVSQQSYSDRPDSGPLRQRARPLQEQEAIFGTTISTQCCTKKTVRRRACRVRVRERAPKSALCVLHSTRSEVDPAPQPSRLVELGRGDPS